MKALILNMNLLICLFCNIIRTDIPAQNKQVIVNDEFVINVLDNDLSYKNIISIYQPKIIIKKITKNPNWPKVKDTLVNFNVNGDSFLFHKSGYKGEEKITLVNMTLISKKVII